MALLETVDKQCDVIEEMAGIIRKQATALEQAEIAKNELDSLRGIQEAVCRKARELEEEMQRSTLAEVGTA